MSCSSEFSHQTNIDAQVWALTVREEFAPDGILQDQIEIVFILKRCVPEKCIRLLSLSEAHAKAPDFDNTVGSFHFTKLTPGDVIWQDTGTAETDSHIHDERKGKGLEHVLLAQNVVELLGAKH